MRKISVKSIILVLGFISWVNSASAEPTSNAEPKIGAIVPLAGDFAKFGARIRRGILAAGAPSERFVFEDEGCMPKPALTAFNYLSAQRGIRFFVGPTCGAPQVVVAPLLERAQSVAVVGNSAPRRVFAESNGRMFSSQLTIEDESTFNAQQFARLQIDKVVLVLYESDFSRTHEAAFKAAFHGKVLDTLVHSSADQAEIRLFAIRIKKLNPQALYVPDGYPLILGLMKELQRVGLSSLSVFSIYAAQSEDVLVASGTAAENIIYSYPDIGDKDALEFFPELAARLLLDAMKDCNGQVDCTLTNLKKNNQFDQYGALNRELTLKTVRAGKFVSFDSALEDEWHAKRR